MTGDQADAFRRVKSLLPQNWFGQDAGPTPILDGLLQGAAWGIAFIYSLYAYAVLQTRILTATGGWLDMIAGDFFGAGLTRAQGQSDNSFRARILANLFRERGTRNSVIQILVQLTGRAPIIIEPRRVPDCGAYGAPFWGYRSAGRYGSHVMPFQAFVRAFRPHNAGGALFAGYRIPAGAYSTPSRAVYASAEDIAGAITDADIYAAVDSVRPIGATLWVNISP